MNARTSRRRMLIQSGVAVCAAAAAPRRLPAALATGVRELRTISSLPQLYHGWPTVARRSNGELLLTYSGGREAHVCPFGRVELMRSHDEGAQWTWPQVLMDSPIDDRDSGVLETSKGSLLVTTFTSLAYESQLAQAREAAANAGGVLTEEALRRWSAAHDRLDGQQRRAELGVWMIRSTDSGVTWSARFDCLVNSPHGPVQLSDGRLLYAGKDLWREGSRVGVCHSLDDGISWSWLAGIPARQGDSHQNYHELHAVEAADGRLIVHLRNHNKLNYRETLQSESSDGGETWSVPAAIGVWGLPSHLLRLRDGRLLMSYGHRRAPLGNQARVSEDHGRTWSEPLLIYDQGDSGDLGYPSTVELSDGSLLTVWYEKLSGSPRAVLRQAIWSLAGQS